MHYARNRRVGLCRPFVWSLLPVSGLGSLPGSLARSPVYDSGLLEDDEQHDEGSVRGAAGHHEKGVQRQRPVVDDPGALVRSRWDIDGHDLEDILVGPPHDDKNTATACKP